MCKAARPGGDITWYNTSPKKELSEGIGTAKRKWNETLEKQGERGQQQRAVHVASR